MASLFGDFLAREFVIDEPPEDVVEFSPRKARTQTWRNGRPAPEESARDLLSEIALLLGEQERLERLAEELRSSKSQRGREDLGKFFRASLTVMDAFDRVTQMAEALPPSEELHNWLKSVAGIQSRMIKLFERFGLRAMDPVGKAVNLERHEVIEVIHSDSLPDETVVEMRQKGYIFEGKILRDAQVVVAKNERS